MIIYGHMNENILEQEVILINDSDTEVSLGNFHIEEDHEELLEVDEDEDDEQEENIPSILEVNVHDSVIGKSVGPGQL